MSSNLEYPTKTLETPFDGSRSPSGSVDMPTKELQQEGNYAPPQPVWRRNMTLFVCCFAMFFDLFNSGGAVVTLNPIRQEFGIADSTVQWVLTAYSLTYGSFLLTSGKLSDMYHPKPVFIIGFLFVGLFSLGAGFVHSAVGLFVLRAFTGLGAALTVPSATFIIDSLFPHPKTKGIALALFAGAGTLGSILGFVVSGAIVQYADWRWVFWVIACGTLPVAVISLWVIKADTWDNGGHKSLDFVGVAVLTSALILLIFGLSEAPVFGWGSARALAPIIISLFMMAGFFVWEAKIDQKLALIPTYIWFLPNLSVLTMIAFFDLILFMDLFLLLNTYWGVVYGWNEFKISLHFLPLCISGGIVCFAFAPLILAIPPKIVVVVGQLLAGLCTILLIFAEHQSDYWRLVFPAMVLIPIGTASTFLVANVKIVSSLPPNVIGVGSAVFNSAVQIGFAVNTAVITSISTSIDGDVPTSYKGTKSAFYYAVALGVTTSLLSFVFVKSPPKTERADDENTVVHMA